VVHAEERETELDLLFDTGSGTVARPTVTVLRPDDPALVPDSGHEAVTVTSMVPARPDRDRTEPAGFGHHAEQLRPAAERAVPDLRDRLLWREVLTPADIGKATGTEGGAIPAPALAAGDGRWLHPSNSTALPGLFTVGGWSHPGGGLPHAGMSGALVAGLIVEGPDFRGSR
jgi:phytoene dehydrogenase-like protein